MHVSQLTDSSRVLYTAILARIACVGRGNGEYLHRAHVLPAIRLGFSYITRARQNQFRGKCTILPVNTTFDSASKSEVGCGLAGAAILMHMPDF